MNYHKVKEDWAKRRMKVYQMHIDNPEMTEKEIGLQNGPVSKQRIHAVLKRVKAELCKSPDEV